MNWYKKSSISRYKISFPITNRKPAYEYDTIGHYRDSYYGIPTLWAIGQDGKFYEHECEIDTSQEYTTHYRLIESGAFPDNPMATGRYEPKSKTCSVIYYYNKNWKSISDQEREDIHKKVEEILDKMFRNPNIMIFDNW
jgi:hypothetical protein